MRYWLWTIVFGVMFSSGLLAKVYQIPPDLLAEGKPIIEYYQQNPDLPKAKFDFAMYCAYTGQVERGWDVLKQISPEYAATVIEEYEAKIKDDPGNWRYYFKLAFGYYFAHRKEDAVRYFDHVITLDPSNVWAMGYKALVMGDMGRVDEAVALTKAAINMEPNAAALHFLLAEGYRRQGNYFGAMAEMMIVGRLKTESTVKKQNAYDSIP